MVYRWRWKSRVGLEALLRYIEMREFQAWRATPDKRTLAAEMRARIRGVNRLLGCREGS